MEYRILYYGILCNTYLHTSEFRRIQDSTIIQNSNISGILSYGISVPQNFLMQNSIFKILAMVIMNKLNLLEKV